MSSRMASTSIAAGRKSAGSGSCGHPQANPLDAQSNPVSRVLHFTTHALRTTLGQAMPGLDDDRFRGQRVHQRVQEIVQFLVGTVRGH